MRLRIQALDSLRKDMRRGMTDDVKLFLFRAFGNVSIVVDNLHDDLLLFLHSWDESKNARPSRFAEGRAIKNLARGSTLIGSLWRCIARRAA